MTRAAQGVVVIRPDERPDLAAMADRLDRMDERIGFDVTGPAGPDWYALADAADPAVVASWIDGLPATAAGMPGVSASYVGLWLAGALARPLMAAALIEGRALVAAPGAVFVHRTTDGRFDRLAVSGGYCRVSARDRLAGRPGTSTVPDQPAVLGSVADQYHALLDPVLASIRAAAPYGSRGLWGSAFDMIGGASTLVARVAGLPRWDAWRAADTVLDRLSDLVPARCPRPRPFPVPGPTGTELLAVKGTCCLRFREYERRDDPAAWCRGCPFIDDEARMDRSLAKLTRPR